MQQYIKDQIHESIVTKLAVQEVLTPAILQAGLAIATAVNNGRKVLCCGNGGSAADAQHFSAELLGRYVKERPSLPAIALSTDSSTVTSIANDYGYENVFSRQIQGLGQKGDVLLIITTSGNSENLLQAVKVAREKEMQIVALTGKGGGKLAKILQDNDIHVCVPSDTTSRVQEAHIMILHCLCDVVDAS